MAPASLWAGHSQPSRSLRPMITSCALCLLRGARCRQSAGVLGFTASACHHSKAASGCLMAPASLWAGHSQPSRSHRPMTTSCALCLLRGAQCRQSAGVLSSSASACHHSKAASGCLMAPASRWAGHSQPSRSLRPMTTSCALCLLRGAQCRQGCRDAQLLIWLDQTCQWVPHDPSKPVDWSQPAQQVTPAHDHVMCTLPTQGR